MTSQTPIDNHGQDDASLDPFDEFAEQIVTAFNELAEDNHAIILHRLGNGSLDGHLLNTPHVCWCHPITITSSDNPTCRELLSAMREVSTFH